MTEEVVCYHCGARAELESQAPGIRTYKPCKNCGRIGVRTLIDGQDLWEPPESRRKKANRVPYWDAH